MYFVSERRYNPSTGTDAPYYRIKESFRDALGRPRNRLMLTPGFIETSLSPYDIRDIGRCLTRMMENGGPGDLFPSGKSGFKAEVQRLALAFWQAMVDKGSVDAVRSVMVASREQAKRMVDVHTVRHTDVREAGAEWICLQAIRELQLDAFLSRAGWTEKQIDTALAHLIVRCVYSPSELKTLDIMRENSSVCELVSGKADWLPSLHSLYSVAPALYGLKEELDAHLCRRTDDLFHQHNRIVLFDLTNFYFEGRK